MLVDNLLDATHLSYLHSGSVGGSSPDVHMVAQNDLSTTDNGIILTRFMQNSPPPETYNNCVELPDRIDRWQEFEFVAPSTVLQYSGGVPTGEDRITAGAPRFDMRIFHTITPETDTSCFYFWSVSNGHETDNPAATVKLTDEIQVALAEDKAMVEAQQLRVTELGEDRLVDHQSDKPRVSARWAIKRLNERQNPESA
jgi:vanillate O-demethylase monooxygenase subunit